MALLKQISEMAGRDLDRNVLARQKRQVWISRIFCLALFLISVVVVMAI
jgi:hypothetical protein